jgi:hypothetical protein
MPLKISDSRLASLYANYERQLQRSANFKLGRDQALEILAQVGDRAGWSPGRVLAELKKPGLSQEAQIALARKGLSSSEKKDIETILDEGKVPLDPTARAFLEAVVGRTGGGGSGGGSVGVDGLTIIGDQKNGLSGVTKPGAIIEAINISAAPAGRLHMDDTMVIARADASGRFDMAKLTGDQAMREGDLIRMRARYADGTTSDWLTVKAHGIEARDSRNAKTVGKVKVRGGAPGTTDLIPDPALHRDELNADGTPKFGKKRFTGPLFIDGAKPGDVQQGQLGDCYFPAAMAAIAQAAPDAITNLIKDNGDGTYTVTFKQRDWLTGRFKDVPIKVDGDLYTGAWGGPLYGRSSNSADPRKMELWFPLVEKAYAQWKGSYDAIGDGGAMKDVFENCLGVETGSMSLAHASADKVWERIVSSVDNHKPVGAGTYGEDKRARYTNTGVVADHAYSILGYKKGANGERFVVLRNPWGQSEPAGNGPNDGVFKLKLEDFTRLYKTLYFVR